MYNVLIDGLPDSYEGYPVNTDYETGIQIMKVMEDTELTLEERLYLGVSLLFDDLEKPSKEIAMDALMWWLTGWNNDIPIDDNDKTVVMDMDVDQWRIYSAFRSQYQINLMKDELHFWEFMALLTTLDDCAFTRVIDIRMEKESSEMTLEEKKALRRAKKRYSLKTEHSGKESLPLTQEEEEFLKYANLGKEQSQ